MPDFTNLGVIVTGGASGIGAAIAHQFSIAGARVAVLDLNPAGADPALLAVPADIGDDESVRAAVATVAREFGRIDILVNNAGIGARGTVADSTDEEWLRVLNVNVIGTARVSRAALPFLKQSPSAAIVNTSSYAANVGVPERAAYTASKGAISALTRAMAVDHLADGIRVNCVCPGTADTPWVAKLLQASTSATDELNALNARQPHGRMVSAEEVAEAVLYLASPSAGSTTGISLSVDGGIQYLRPRGQSA